MSIELTTSQRLTQTRNSSWLPFNRPVTPTNKEQHLASMPNDVADSDILPQTQRCRMHRTHDAYPTRCTLLDTRCPFRKPVEVPEQRRTQKPGATVSRKGLSGYSDTTSLDRGDWRNKYSACCYTADLYCTLSNAMGQVRPSG
jgi:hypothetical protein